MHALSVRTLDAPMPAQNAHDVRDGALMPPIRTPALAVYLMAGDEFPELAEAAVQAGATAIELGIPYSDPLADGPSIQRAGQRALEAGITPPRALEIQRATRERLGPDVPIIPMTYLAIVERYGIERFCT